MQGVLEKEKLTEYLGPEPIFGSRNVIKIMMAITMA